MSLPKTKSPPRRVQILEVAPQAGCGRCPVKRVAGDGVDVSARIFCDGHDALGARVRFRRHGDARWQEAALEPRGNDRWTGSFAVDRPGPWSFRVEAWAEGAAGAPARSPEYGVDVDRELARFGAWYELFPRSFGGFEGVRALLPRLAELGFDVVYFPPVHPIGTTNRKGANNAITAGPGDPGSPWAIGGAEGGHDAVDPGLGTVADFERLVAGARSHGLEIAIDFAAQCSPDHPWVNEHPDWFQRRGDGTLKYAENPPKRYEDIVNLDFGCDDWKGLWSALRDVVVTWVGRGVTVFRVDNPHTKPVPFWEWLIAEVRRDHPDVIFLAEAFTRPAMMTTLAKAGFAQSYTYFTWKNTRWELLELVGQWLDWKEIYRPNAFVNTPDILHAYLQRGGPPAFEARLVLAATLSPSYGIYSGFERFENAPLREGSEEYLDSEKYEVKRRALDGPLLPLIATVNRARRESPALQRLDNVTFLETENEQLLAYRKQTGDDVVVVAVNLDPLSTQRGVCVLPATAGLPAAFTVRDLLSGNEWRWRTGRNYVELAPGKSHVLRMRR